MTLSSFVSSLSKAFRPPFKGAAVVVWAYFVWCFLIHPDTAILRGSLIDPDDAMHLTQVLDWLNGQSWFDTVQHRLNPPEGTLSHFSRLAELPLAALVSVFKKVGLSWTGASLVTAAVWPLTLFGLFLSALAWTARPFLPRDWTRASAYVALFATGVTFQFMPGRVDHHGLALLLVLLMMGCVLRLLSAPWRTGIAVLAGVLGAFALTVALETLPWVLLLAFALGAALVAKGRELRLAGLAFGLTFYLAMGAFLLLSRKGADLTSMNPLLFSAVYVLMAGCVAACFAGVAALPARAGFWGRAAIGGLLAAFFGGLFFTRVPDMLRGPYGAMDPELAAYMFSSISEAQPLLAHGVALILEYTAMPFFALGVTLFHLRGKEGRALWGLFALLQSAALGIALFYQGRFLVQAELFALLPMTVLLKEGLAISALRFRGRTLVAAELGVILLVGPLLSVFLPALLDGRSFNKGVLLFPVAEVNKQNKACFSAGLWQVLNGHGQGQLIDSGLVSDGKPKLIMSPISMGPDILLRTPHKVLAGPYHTNVSGNLDTLRFFNSIEPIYAEEIARRRGVDLVVVCKALDRAYFGTNAGTTNMNLEGEVLDRTGMSLGEKLAIGKPPEWLRPVGFPLMGDVRLYRVLSPQEVEDAKRAKMYEPIPVEPIEDAP